MGKKKYNIEKFEPHREKREFPKGKSGILICGVCEALYFKKAWQHKIRVKEITMENCLIKKTICPACLMIKNKQFEGEITIENIPAKIINDLLNLINSFGKTAFERDNQHRLIAIKKINKNSIMATTTENQMALQLAKKIKNTFKKDAMKISLSPTPSDVVYIKLKFRNEE